MLWHEELKFGILSPNMLPSIICGNPDHQRQPQEVILDPDHFYAAYVLDHANERESDIGAILECARELGYPVRYW